MRFERLSRRRFLAQAAATAAAPLILPRKASGLNSPNERITLGLIGMGTQGARVHLRILGSLPETEVAALCDVEEGRLAHHLATANAGGNSAKAYRDYEELLARGDIDAVVVASPDHWHARMAIGALEAGKDVYCEKPLAFSIAEGRAIVDAVERTGRIFQTGSQQRSDYRFRHACELVRNGYIGTVLRVGVNVGGPAGPCYLPPEPVPEGLDWDRWLGPAPWRPFSRELVPPFEAYTYPKWRYYRDYAHGGLSDFGAHHFDIAQWGLGTDQTGPREIIPPGAEDNEHLIMRYPGGIELVHRGAADWAAVEFFGAEGRVRVQRGRIETDPAYLADLRLKPGDQRLYRSDNHHLNFLECVRTRRDPICPAGIGHRSLSVCLLADIAFRLKRKLYWDAEREFFLSDEEANRLLARAERAAQ